jgi:murein DD-endopeptidase MepM/ murein hydrolase activator NlpD
MRRAALALALAAAVVGLQGCDRQPSVTHVLSAGPSASDDTRRDVPDQPAPQVSTQTEAAGPRASAAPAPPTAMMGAAPAASASAARPAEAAPSGTVAPPPSGAAAQTPAGTAAPTEMSRALQPAGAASGSSGPVSLDLPAVRDPGDAEGARLLAQHELQLPVQGVQPAALSDNFLQARGERKHEAIDILADRGTPVMAVDDGRIAKLFTSKPGGLTIYQFDPEAKLAYYYAHLDGYAAGVREGMDVKRGDVIGYVGSTGNADAKTPHLHFAVFRLGTPPKWWVGEAVNPYPALSRAKVAAR